MSSWTLAFILLVGCGVLQTSTVVAFYPIKQPLALGNCGQARVAASAFRRNELPSTRRDGATVQRATSDMKMSFSFKFPTFGRQNQAPKKANADALSEELFSLLSDKSRMVNEEEIMDKIERLEASGVKFNEDYLYDGPWRVLWKTNTAWQRYFDPFNNVADNRAYQWYKKDGSVTNIAQALGDKLYVTVDGQGTPASNSKQLPYEVNVEVSRGWLHALGGKIPLDFIKGKGTTYVVYNDPKLRVFRSDTGGVVVQTKAEERVLA